MPRHECFLMHVPISHLCCSIYACLSMNALPCMLPSSDWHLKDFFKSNSVMLLEIRILRRHASKSANAASKRSGMLLPSQRLNLQASNTWLDHSMCNM